MFNSSFLMIQLNSVQLNRAKYKLLYSEFSVCVCVRVFVHCNNSSFYSIPCPQTVCNCLVIVLFIIFSTHSRNKLENENNRIISGAQKIIDERIQLEYEREQQEQLLLSVIPAYIAAEVKRRIMNKMNDAANKRTSGGDTSASTSANGNSARRASSHSGGGGSGSKQHHHRNDSNANGVNHCDLLPKTPQKQRFHELYVQRHNNVR